MANEEHLAILRQGVEVWNRWREANPTLRPDFRRMDLSEFDLKKADLQGTDFRRSDLRRARLQGANLSRADLSGASIRRAFLQRVQLQDADLSGADLTGTDLTAADLRRATFHSTVFADMDLSAVIGLETAKHQGPSTVGIDTLYKSGGKIPTVFLRGCGVPDSTIEYLPSLLGAMEPIQFYSCFISYSSQDEDFAQRLYSRMRDHHLRVWFAPEDMKAGAKIHEQIDQAIRVYDKLVLVLSEESIKSEWVMTEIRKARKAELRDQRRKLFPIRLVDMDTLRDWECFDADIGKDLAVEVREYFIPDFTRWKDHDSFERAFARFLNDLQATETPPIPRAVEAPKIADSKGKAGAQETIIAIKKRRLQLLEEQQARTGHNTPPEITMEIEDLRREIDAREAE